jgi:hypothetical protein
MNSQDETQLSDDLRHIVDDQPFAPNIEAIEHRGQLKRRRGLAARGLAGLTVLGVAVAAGLVVNAHGGTAGKVANQAITKTATRKAPAKTGGTAKLETVAYVQQQIAAAALNLNNYLIESRGKDSDPPYDEITIWTDPRTGNTLLLEYSGYNRIAYWMHTYFDSQRVLHWDQTQVNYGPRTWWNLNEHAGSPIQGPVPKGPESTTATPADVEQVLKEGVGKIVGHPYVDGHHTVELSIALGTVKTYVIYADVHTFQVVRTIDYFPSTPDAKPIQDDYTWVKRSAAMVKLVNHPVVPADFTQVSGD